MVQGPKSKISEIVLVWGRPTPGDARRPNLRSLGPSVPKLLAENPNLAIFGSFLKFFPKAVISKWLEIESWPFGIYLTLIQTPIWHLIWFQIWPPGGVVAFRGLTLNPKNEGVPACYKFSLLNKKPRGYSILLAWIDSSLGKLNPLEKNPIFWFSTRYELVFSL